MKRIFIFFLIASIAFGSGNFEITEQGVKISSPAGDQVIFLSGAGLGTFENLKDNSLTVSTGVYTTSGKILTTTAPVTGTLGFWTRTPGTITTATAGDAITTTGSISDGVLTISDGTISGLVAITESFTWSGTLPELTASDSTKIVILGTQTWNFSQNTTTHIFSIDKDLITNVPVAQFNAGLKIGEGEYIGPTSNITLIQLSDGLVNIDGNLLAATLNVGTPETPGLSFMPNPIVQIVDDMDAVAGVEMRNKSAGTSADFRFIVYNANDDAYLAFAMPGHGNALTLFGENRSDIATIFSNADSGGSGRKLCIGTVDAFSLIFGTQNTNRIEIDSAGQVNIGNPGTTDLTIEADADTYWVGAGTGLPYGSLFLHEGAANVDITGAGADVYVKITGFDAGLMNEVTENSDAFNVARVGVYKVDWQVSADSQGNNLTYEIDIFVDGVEQSDGSSRRKFGAAADFGSMSGTAILDIDETDDDIDIRMKQVGGVASDVDIFNMSFNIGMYGGT